MPVSPRTDRFRHADPAALSPPARLVLDAVRGWFDAGGHGPGFCLTLARAGLPAVAVTRLAAALSLIGVSGCRAIALHAPGSTRLSRDEGQLLIALAALQAGEPWRAQRATAEWLPPPLVPRMIGLLAAFAAALAWAGLRLPREPVDETALPPAWPPGRPPALH
jgi:hypothetical protein